MAEAWELATSRRPKNITRMFMIDALKACDINAGDRVFIYMSKPRV